jgi:hypothetical protein
MIEGAVAWGAALVAITEILSAYGRLGRLELVVSWITFAAIAFALGRRSRAAVVSPTAATRHSFADLDSLSRAQLAAIASLLLVALFLAYVAAPATADSMTYHLPRIQHWIQNRSVAPYPTNSERELWPGPGAEFIMLHLEILSGGDRGATLLQWAAYAADIAIVSLIASQLGVTLRGQATAAFLAATIPGAVAQATGSQVELVFAFWLACAVSLGLRLRVMERGDRWLGTALVFGAAIGLAVLTKATAYLYFAPFALWFLVSSLRGARSTALFCWVIAGLIAIAINAPQYSRNFSVYHNLLGRPGADGVVNSSFFPGGIASNVV